MKNCYDIIRNKGLCYLYMQKLKSQKQDVLEWILNKKHIFNSHKYFGCLT